MRFFFATRLRFVALAVSLALPCCRAGAVLQDPSDISDAGLSQSSDGQSAPAAPASPGTGNAGATTPTTLSGTQVAMYYGTGNSAGKDPALSTLCQSKEIGIIILSFADGIASHSRNKDGYPEMSINGCAQSKDDNNPYLPDCTELGKSITACQAAGKKVILSLGGGGARVGFQSDNEASAYATMIWQLFLGGKSDVRPFGTTLDGIDLDIEGGNSTGYAAFVNALRKLMDADLTRHYLITAAPQCIYPDEWMGPGKGTALTDALTAFDYLFVQFYNNDCRFAATQRFEETWGQWTSLGPKQPKILVGLPGAVDAADAASYVEQGDLKNITQKVGSDANFGGLMFWDAGYDADHIAAGETPMRTAARNALDAILTSKFVQSLSSLVARNVPRH